MDACKKDLLHDGHCGAPEKYLVTSCAAKCTGNRRKNLYKIILQLCLKPKLLSFFRRASPRRYPDITKNKSTALKDVRYNQRKGK